MMMLLRPTTPSVLAAVTTAVMLLLAWSTTTVVVVVVEASTGASLDQAGETIDGLVDGLETLVLNTPNDCILHILNPVVGNTVSIESNPSGLAAQYGFLVDSVDGGTFLLQYESPNSASGQSGTITINVPLDRPRDLFVSGSTKVLVNDGFNALRKLEISNEAQVNGYMTSSEAARVQIAVLDSAKLAFDVGDDLVVEIDQHSDQAQIERVLTARALGSSTIKLKGDITSIRCENTATCTVDGSLVRDPLVDNSGALSPTATFSEGAVSIDTSTTTSGTSCTNGPNPVLTATTSNGGSNTGLWGEVDGNSNNNGDIPSGGGAIFSAGGATTAVVVVVAVMISGMMGMTTMVV